LAEIAIDQSSRIAQAQSDIGYNDTVRRQPLVREDRRDASSVAIDQAAAIGRQGSDEAVRREAIQFQTLTDRITKMGVPADMAAKIAAGLVERGKDEDGNSRMIDMTTGNMFGGPPKAPDGLTDAQRALAAPPPGSTMPDGVPFSEATGPMGAFKGGLNIVAGLAGQPGNEDYRKAKDAITDLGFRTVQAVSKSIPGRPSNDLMARIDRLVVRPNELIRNDYDAKSRFEQTRELLNREILGIEDLINMGKLSPNKHAEAFANYQTLRGLKSDYDKVLENFDSVKPKEKGAPAPRDGRLRYNPKTGDLE
jgi:hypothetical protein